MGNSQRKERINSSFIRQENSSFLVRTLKKVDVFSFIPVPKDQPVSTLQSLIGTLVFFLLILTYIIFDFVSFIIYNPVISQVYYTKINQQNFSLPKFGLSFMYSNYLNQTDLYSEYISYEMTQQMKDKGIKQTKKIPIYVYQYDNQTYDHGSIQNLPINPYKSNLRGAEYSKSNQINYIQQVADIKADTTDTNWLDQETKRFYNVIRFPSNKTYAKGLLYSTSEAQYAKASISLCNISNASAACATLDEIKLFLAGGRVFLFVQDMPDNSPLQSSNQNNQNKFMIYNFYLTPQIYKRVTFRMQVEITQIFPDYFWRWSTEINTKVKINDVLQQTSDVTANFVNTTSLDMLGISFQLVPQIMNVRIQSLTLIDKISMWGALWGTLFGIFALIFLSYNRQKFYKKNPDWNSFKRTNKKKSFITTEGYQNSRENQSQNIKRSLI